MKSFIDYFNDLEIDIKDPKFDLISNYTKFQAAKEAGKIGEQYEDILVFLKYESLTRRRSLVLKRLFDLAMKKYKCLIAEEFFNMTGTRV